MRNRNQLCECGSGRKYKKCCALKEPRETVITWDLGSPVAITEVRRDQATNEVEIYSFGRRVFPKNITVERRYKKINKDDVKVVSKSFGNKRVYLSKPSRALDDFDLVYAIDTNWKTVHGVKLCASGVVKGTKLGIVVPNKMGYRFTLRYCFSFASSGDKPENFAWVHLIRKIPLWDNAVDNKVGLVVDSDLGKLGAYNAGTEKIFDNFELPRNCSLLYASSERDTNDGLNKMVNIADFGAEFLLGKFVESQKQKWEVLCFDDIKVWTVEQKDPKSITLRS